MRTHSRERTQTAESSWLKVLSHTWSRGATPFLGGLWIKIITREVSNDRRKQPRSCLGLWSPVPLESSKQSSSKEVRFQQLLCLKVLDKKCLNSLDKRYAAYTAHMDTKSVFIHSKRRLKSGPNASISSSF